MTELDFPPADDQWIPDNDPGPIEPGYTPPTVDDGFVIELEQDLLGALLNGGDHSRVFSILKPHNFVEPIHQEIFGLITAARESYSSTTLPTVVKIIPSMLAETFKAATSMALSAYMADCASRAFYGAGQSYAGAKNVLEQWARVSLGREAETIVEASRDPHAKSLEILRTASTAFDDVMADLRSGGRGRTLSAFGGVSVTTLDAAREAKQKGGYVGVATGLVDFDRATGGLHRSDLIIVAARPSMAKTTVGTCWVRNVASRGIGAGFISLEMDKEKLAARIISEIAQARGIRVPYQDLINGTAELDTIDALQTFADEYNELPLWIEDQSGLTVTEIKVKAEKMAEAAEKAGHPLGILIVDHMHLIRPSTRYAGNRVHEISEISGGLKVLAKDMGIPVVLLAQLNRALETRDDKRPQLSDLRDSGSIEQDSDVVLFPYRKAYYLDRAKPKDPDQIIKWEEECRAAANDLELAIAKQRNGPIKTIDLFVDMPCSAVRNKAVGYGGAL